MSFHEYSPLGETEDGSKVFIRGNIFNSTNTINETT